MMSQDDAIATMAMDVHALRLLHRVVSDAYSKWPGGPQEEQVCLHAMKTQLYAALMDHLLDAGAI